RVEVEEFHFLTWELFDQPSLTLHGGSQTLQLESFTPFHLSWPTTNEGLRREIAVYGEGDRGQVEGRVLIVGVDELILKGELGVMLDHVREWKPAAVIYTSLYPFSWECPYVSYSCDGKLFWPIKAPSGWISRQDWVKIMELLKAEGEVEAEVRIPARIGYGAHYNVLGDVDGVDVDRTFIVSAHYDTVMTPGFIDNAAGVAGVLAMAEAFNQARERGFKPPFNIRFAFFTAEELGLLGSLNYASKHKGDLSKVVGVVNLDSIGSLRLMVVKSPSILDELAEEAATKLKTPLTGGCRMFSYKSSSFQAHQTGADHLSFQEPEAALQLAKTQWPRIQLPIDTRLEVPAITISSRPLFASYIRTGEEPGWIHTSYDNSTTPGWVDVKRLEQHVKVSTLTVVKAMWTAITCGALNPAQQSRPNPASNQVGQVFFLVEAERTWLHWAPGDV
ncbi:MAG: M28 family metallopeptidase, partial [Candidatus Bathyarchaeia archaeon]